MREDTWKIDIIDGFSRNIGWKLSEIGGNRVNLWVLILEYFYYLHSNPKQVGSSVLQAWMVLCFICENTSL